MKKYGFITNLVAGIIGGLIVLITYIFVFDESVSHTEQQKALKQKTSVSSVYDSNQSQNFNAKKVNSFAAASALENQMVNAAQKTVDAVVHVKTAYMKQYSYGNPFLDYFFGDRGQRREQPVLSSGSGVIISEDGYIVTNNHVIDKAQKIKVVLNDKREYEAELVGTDPATDIALLKVDEEGMPHIKAGNSDKVEVGEWVLAVGNPFNLTSTVTAGIVSAKARNINLLKKNYGIEAFIQTDAAVNPGNSGGALVNRKGQLVGINTAIASKTGSFTGYSFAVPVNIAMKAVEDLIEYGQVQRAVMGIVIHDLNESFAQKNDIETLNGVYIDKTSPNSAADQAGIEPGDIITRIGSVEINNVAELQEQLSKFRPGDKVNVTILRNNKAIEKTVVLHNRRGNTEIIKGKDPVTYLGATFQEVSDKEKRLLGIRHGLKIVALESGKLRSAGIHKGFIILEMNGVKITSENDIREVVQKSDGGVMVEGIYPNGMKAYYAFGN